MKWLWLAGGLAAVLALVVGALLVVGARLPRHHVASRRVTIRRPPAEVFAVMRDFARAPEWRKDVKRVELMVGDGGGVRFREEGAHGPITMEVVEEVPAVRLVTRIADDSLPFGGTWTYELSPAPASGTDVVITERGEVKPALFRALSQYVFTHHRTIDQYLRALGARFGESVTPSASAAGAS
jgi:uncharacterized protein YndB with AHSA1/START domain